MTVSADNPLTVLREALEEHVPDGSRDDDGVWWDGPHLIDALAALAQVEHLVMEAELALDCKGSYNGTVSENGGYPALCTRCESALRAALLPFREEGGSADSGSLPFGSATQTGSSAGRSQPGEKT